MELTLPRSPTISFAIAAYVVSEVTTFTGAAGGCDFPGPASASTTAMIDSMSVRLVFMWSNGPDRLNRDLVVGIRIADSLPLVLGTEEHPFTMPESECRRDLAGNYTEFWGYKVEVMCV